MHSIKLSVNSYTSSGGAHTSLLIDGHDTGVLYLTDAELNILTKILRKGALEDEDTTFHEVAADEDEVDLDIFS